MKKGIFVLLFILMTSNLFANDNQQDWAPVWKFFDDTDKKLIAVTYMSAFMVPMLFLRDSMDVLEENDSPTNKKEIEKLRHVFDILDDFFSTEDGKNMISPAELKLRLDLYYLDDKNKYQLFEYAVYRIFLDLYLDKSYSH